MLSVSPGGEKACLDDQRVTSLPNGTLGAIPSHHLNFFLDEACECGNGKLALVCVFSSGLGLLARRRLPLTPSAQASTPATTPRAAG